ncbi:hypothetical protein ACFYXQ_15735 [Nocardia jiangxiensis]|uniref:Uncharacterized protein n=1 Tax=Nocardia jiangxiensis TaxID=282685 RepID=A0ABW6RYX7_9NOCA
MTIPSNPHLAAETGASPEDNIGHDGDVTYKHVLATFFGGLGFVNARYTDVIIDVQEAPSKRQPG